MFAKTEVFIRNVWHNRQEKICYSHQRFGSFRNNLTPVTASTRLDETFPSGMLVGDPTSSQSRSLPHITALDGLRGLAILWVVLHHAGAVARDRDSFGGTVLSNFSGMGWVGVDLFFVLSGFLISSILIRSYGRKGWLKNFIARRALRVLPLYFVVIFVCFNLIPWLPFENLQWLRELSKDQWWYWLHLANFRKMVGDANPEMAAVGWFSTYWSLSIEEHFYLLWPVLLLLVTPRNLGWIATIGVTGVIILRIGIAMTNWPESFIYNNTFTRIDGLLLGSLLAWLNQFHRSFLIQLGYVAGCLFLIGGLAFMVPMYLGFVGGGRSTIYGKMVLYSASAFCGTAIVWHLITQPTSTWINRFFNTPLLRSFGKYSYAIYVFNKPIIAGVAAISNPYMGKLSTLNYLICFSIICGLCWIAGLISWNLIEAPCLKLKNKFSSHLL